MGVRRLKPNTPGTRYRVVNTFDEITEAKPEKSLLAPIKKSGGRNNTGKMTMRNIGGGHKRRYRIIDFKRTRRDKAEASIMKLDSLQTAQ
jgi:large subunit ribosomal protein L2